MTPSRVLLYAATSIFAIAFALGPAVGLELEETSSPTVADASSPFSFKYMKVGGVGVRVEAFRELRDGTIQARVSFRNPSPSDAAYLALQDSGSDKAQLTNGSGASYRLVDISPPGDAPTVRDWTSLAPGSSVSVSATFAPNDVERGVQPFALTIPVRLVWQPEDQRTERTSTFDVNFRGLRRRDVAVNRVPPPRIINETPSLAAPVTVQPDAAKFEDDLSPLVKALPPGPQDPHRYLFAIGISEYDDAPDVPHAERSAQAMADLLRKRFGVPAENATVVTGSEATGMKILGRLNSVLQQLQEGDTLYFYYAGHGLAARDGHTVYVVPKDAVPGAYEVDLLSLTSLLNRFDASAATRVVAFLNTCFSGRVSGNESLFPGVGPLVMTPVEPAAAKGLTKTTMFLAGQAYQFANDYPEHGHRLFSYFLMRGLLDGNDDPNTLQTYVAREVRRISAKRGAEYVQEPQLQGITQSLDESTFSRRRALR